MKFKHLLLATLGLSIFSSCQKGVDWATTSTTGSNTGGGTTGGTTGGGTSGDLLVKVVSVTGAETVTTLYTYDASKRLITEDIKGSSGGLGLDSYQKFYRDANGRIYKVAQLLKQPGVLVDTAFIRAYYPSASSSNITYTTTDVSAAGFGTHDSTVYSWDGNNNVTSGKSYFSSSSAPGLILFTDKSDYFYTNGNLTQLKTYSDASTPGSLSLIITYNFTFDSNINPMRTNGSEFLLTSSVEGASKNNITKVDIADITTPSNSRTITTAITYDAGNKPISGIVTLQPQNQVSRYTFFYQ